ncbi:hypothetical protein [Arthrobacter sp. MMS24-S77]
MNKWQAVSFKRGWRVRTDWLQPEVELTVTSLETGSVVPAGTARSLGAARARSGVGISETMTDFRALFAAADRRLDLDALQSLAEGWAEGADPESVISCTDVYTGLATPAHFQGFIHELFASGPEHVQAHVLAVIALRQPHELRCHPWPVLAMVGETVSRDLRGTGAVAMYRNSAVHLAFRRSEANLARLVECKVHLDVLADGALMPTRLEYFPLPTSPEDAKGLLAGVTKG